MSAITDEQPPVLADRPEDGIARITLNRPGKLNAINVEMLEHLRAALEAAAANPDVRCVLLTGAGRAFCAGQDLGDRDPRKLDTMPDLEAVQRDLFHPVVCLLRGMDKPVVCAVRGVASGAGAAFALACDLVFAARDATFAFSFVRVGLSADAGLGWALTHALGAARARGLLLTGGKLSGQEAVDAGLIWQAADDDHLDEAALAAARDFATGPAIAFCGIKATVNAALAAPDFDAYLEAEAAAQGRAGASGDYREGVLAFLEKRKAEFDGR